jgi:hypothetical protein
VLFHFHGAEIFQEKFRDSLNDNCVQPLVEWLLSLQTDLTVQAHVRKQVASDKHILIENFLELRVLTSDDFEFLKGLECVSPHLDVLRLLHILLASLHCEPTLHRASPLLFDEVHLVSIYDSFVFALDLEVVRDK